MRGDGFRFINIDLVVSEEMSTFAPMKHCFSYLLLLFLLMGGTAWGQTTKKSHVNPEDRPVDMDNPTFVPLIKVSKVMHEGDSIQYIEMNNVYVYPQPVFKNEKQRQAYNRLVYNVKKALTERYSARVWIQPPESRTTCL